MVSPNSKYVYEDLPHSGISKSSIDDASPEEWNAVGKKTLKKKSVKGESE